MAKAEFHVLMCGGRRTGKTSILAAMKENMEQETLGGRLFVTMENAGDLTKYNEHIKNIFDPTKYKSSRYPAEDNPTFEKTDYRWGIQLDQKYLHINFTDIPGEWFIFPEHHDELVEQMRKSQILVIAVDSPHLVEERDKDPLIGEYHDIFNRPDQVTSFIQEAFQGNKMARLVVFVPMKCEKYMYSPDDPDNNMSHLLDAVKAGYKELLDYLQNGDNKKLCSVVIAPCLTVGGMEFMGFAPGRDENNDPRLDQNGEPIIKEMNNATGLFDLVLRSEYKFVMNNGNRSYSPKYCEQPLYYVLLFIIDLTFKSKSLLYRLVHTLFFGGLIDSLMTMADQHSNAALSEYQKQMLERLVCDKSLGFEILNDPEKAFKTQNSSTGDD